MLTLMLIEWRHDDDGDDDDENVSLLDLRWVYTCVMYIPVLYHTKEIAPPAREAARRAFWGGGWFGGGLFRRQNVLLGRTKKQRVGLPGERRTA